MSADSLALISQGEYEYTALLGLPRWKLRMYMSCTGVTLSRDLNEYQMTGDDKVVYELGGCRHDGGDSLGENAAVFENS